MSSPDPHFDPKDLDDEMDRLYPPDSNDLLRPKPQRQNASGEFFGLGVILMGVMLMIGGLYLPQDEVWPRTFCLFTGMVVIAIGAWYFDRKRNR